MHVSKLWPVGHLPSCQNSSCYTDIMLLKITCETSQVLLAGSQVFFLGDLPFSPHLTIDLAQNEWNNLDGSKTQIK